MTWDKFNAPSAWADLECDIESFEVLTNAIGGVECNLTEKQWNDIRRDLEKGIGQFSDDLIANTIDDYLNGHYSEK